jgi:hypothetical protein
MEVAPGATDTATGTGSAAASPEDEQAEPVTSEAAAISTVPAPRQIDIGRSR